MDKKLNLTQELELCQKYTSGVRGFRISKEYDISPSIVYKTLRKHGYSVRNCSRRKYELDESLLDNIDCEWKAYFLGLLMADGCVQKNKCLKIALKEDDKEILEILNNKFFKNNPLRYEPAREYMGKDGKPRKNSAKYFFTVNSEKIWKRVQELGCGQAKSLTLEFPTNIPKNLMSHFVRGYFDGDGGISLPFTWHIISSKVFCLSLQEYLNNVLKIKSYYSPHNKVARLRVHRKIDNQKLFNYLYSDATIFLQRKKDKFENIL